MPPPRAHIECAPTDCAAKRGIDGYRPLHRRGGFHICPRGFPPPHTATAARGLAALHTAKSPGNLQRGFPLCPSKTKSSTLSHPGAAAGPISRSRSRRRSWRPSPPQAPGAATAMGRQSPVMLAVQDKENAGRAVPPERAVMGTKNDPFYGAPTAVLVLGEKNNPNGVQDASLVMGNLLLAASGIGLGSCWINRAKKRRLKRPRARLCWPSGALIPRSTSASATAFLAIPRPMAPAHPAPARPAMSCTYDFRRRHRPV